MSNLSINKRRQKRRSGFTFLEIMMVVGIALVLATLSVPMFINSYRGAKLKASVRTVSMVHKYARSISVLKQRQAAVLLYKNGSIQVVSLTPTEGGAEMRGRMTDLPSMTGGGDDDRDYTPNIELEKKLEEDVSFGRIDLDDGGLVEEGVYMINYYPNGMCDKYTVRLRDKNDREKRIEIDSISGMVIVDDL